MYTAGRSSLLTVAVVSATLGFNVTVARGQVNCGDTVTGKVAMTMDLTCGASNPGFTIGAGASVDMAGYQLTTCVGCMGVRLSGQGAKLSNGSIVAPGAGSVVYLDGAGVHKVENMVVVGGGCAFQANSDKNKLKNCAAYASSLYGFYVFGSKNAISRSHSSGSPAANFYIQGDNNNLTENTSVDAPGSASGNGGIYVVGNANKLSRNTSTNDDGDNGAMLVAGNGNKLSLNTVADSNATGLYVQGNDNKISKTVATNSAVRGIDLIGNFNKLSKNTATDSAAHGIAVSGNGNNINGSNTNNNTAAGIHVISGDANSLKSNVTMRNGAAEGVYVGTATNSSISKTVALGNALDLRDDNANCGTNLWAKSVFRTSDAGGTMGHACIQ